MSAIESGIGNSLTNLAHEFTKASASTDEIGNTTTANTTTANTTTANTTTNKHIASQQRVSVSDQAKNESQDPLNKEQLEKVAQQLQDFAGEMDRGLQFSVDKDSGRDVIKVIDKKSGDLVKQFPSEEVLTLVSKISEMVGGFIDAKV